MQIASAVVGHLHFHGNWQAALPMHRELLVAFACAGAAHGPQRRSRTGILAAMRPLPSSTAACFGALPACLAVRGHWPRAHTGGVGGSARQGGAGRRERNGHAHAVRHPGKFLPSAPRGGGGRRRARTLCAVVCLQLVGGRWERPSRRSCSRLWRWVFLCAHAVGTIQCLPARRHGGASGAKAALTPCITSATAAAAQSSARLFIHCRTHARGSSVEHEHLGGRTHTHTPAAAGSRSTCPAMPVCVAQIIVAKVK